MIDQKISHYHILAKLGEGGMGVVYKALDVKLDRYVALKFLPAESANDNLGKKRFIQEAKAASALDHPNICAIHEIDETDDGRMFITMGYYEGETLRKLLEKNGACEISRGVRIILQAARGLERAHQSGIIHRDIKPENIIVTEHDEVKILDFGLAKLSGQANLTMVGETVGTAAYMSPEQLQGAEVGKQSDIFSLGVVFYELIAGENPFNGDYAQAIMYSILHDTPASLSSPEKNMPQEVDVVIEKMLAKEAGDRYTDTSQLVDDLQQLSLRIESGVVTTMQPASSGSLRQRRSSASSEVLTPKKSIALAVAAAILVSLFLVILLVPAVRTTLGDLFDIGGVPDAKHVAVLRFSNISGDEVTQAFCDGLVETLTSKLSQLEQFQGSLWIVPASEIRNENVESARQAHKLFGANLVITGSVQLLNELLRLTITLIETETLRQLGSKMIDEQMRNVALIQDEVVIQLAEMLNVELRPESRRVLEAGSTTVPGAYEFYLQGRGTLQRYDNEENIDAAIDLFERALAKDAGYGGAYAGLGEAFLRKFEATKDVRWIDSAIMNCEKALEVDDLLPEAHLTLGLLHTETGRYQQALADFQKALEMNSHYAEAYRGRAKAFTAQGLLEEAEATYKKAISMKPDYWGGYNDLGVFYFRHGRYNEAASQFEYVVSLTPQNALGYTNLGGIYYSLNQIENAVKNYNLALALQPSYETYANLATLYFHQEKYSDAAEMYHKALEIKDSNYIVWGYLASAYKQIPGKKNEMIEATKRAVSLGESRRKINPNDPNVLLNLAGYYLDLEPHRSAVLLERVIALGSKEVSVMYQIGYTFEQLGKRDAAIKWILKALNLGYDMAQIESNPQLYELRKDPRYQKAVRANNG